MNCDHLEMADVRRDDGSLDYTVCRKCGEKRFPKPCVRCGCCCLMDTCKVGQHFYKVKKHERCLGLRFDGDSAICEIVDSLADWGIPHNDVKEAMGVGKGCCLSARLFVGGEQFYFAHLPPDKKIHYVRQMRKEYGI